MPAISESASRIAYRDGKGMKSGKEPSLAAVYKEKHHRRLCLLLFSSFLLPSNQPNQRQSSHPSLAIGHSALLRDFRFALGECLCLETQQSTRTRIGPSGGDTCPQHDGHHCLQVGPGISSQAVQCLYCYPAGAR